MTTLISTSEVMPTIEEFVVMVNSIVLHDAESEKKVLGEMLIKSSREGDLEQVRQLIEKGANVNTQNDNGWNPLHTASFSKKIEVVRLLLERGNGANVNTKNKCGWTSLHLAVNARGLEVISLLIEKGANVDTQDKFYGMTPLHHASSYGHLDTVKLLIAKGADVNIRNKDGKTALQLAKTQEIKDVLKPLTSS